MVLRFLLHLFANNERLVQRLSESYPVRAAAKAVVSVFYRTKSIAEEHNLKEKLSAQNLSKFAQRLKDEYSKYKK